MYRIIYLTIAILALATYGGKVQSYRWPPIAATSRTFHFSGSGIEAQSFTIRGPSGNPVYWLGCHGGLYEGNSGDPDHDDQYDYFGDLDCHLHSLYAPDDGNLLVTDAVGGTEHFSRLLTTAWDLQGACAKYPEWGSLRHVTLRGMAFTFKYSNAVILRGGNGATAAPNEEPRLTSVDLEIKVEPDPEAVSAIALEPPFDRPRYPVSGNPRGISPLCDRVVPRHIPGVDIGSYVREHGLGPPYPQVAPTEGSATFALEEDKDWQMPILDSDGRQVYSLGCRAALGEAGLGRWGVCCELLQAGKDLDLLADSVDPYSRRIRTLFEQEQFDGECAEYPEWGAIRTFKLRGFQLVLRVKSVVLDGTGSQRLGFYRGRIARFDMAAKVVPNRSATSAVALPSRYVDWRFLSRPGACSQVVVDTRTSARE
jgi:hypothetical protein